MTASHSISQMESEDAVRDNKEKCAGVLERLRTSGIRPTIARIGVLQVISAAAPGRISAEEVFRQMMRRGTRASVSTVYRVIHELVGHGLLLREWGAKRKALYRLKPDCFDTEPLRLVCPESGRTVVLADADLYEGLLTAARHHGIDLEGQALSIQVSTVGGTKGRSTSRLSSAHPHLMGLRA